MANLFVLDCDRHEAALSHLRVIARDGEVTAEELAEHEALLSQNLTEAEDAADQNYIARAMLTNGTDTEYVIDLTLRRWKKRGLRVIEGGKGNGQEPEAA